MPLLHPIAHLPARGRLHCSASSRRRGCRGYSCIGKPVQVNGSNNARRQARQEHENVRHHADAKIFKRRVVIRTGEVQRGDNIPGFGSWPSIFGGCNAGWGTFIQKLNHAFSALSRLTMLTNLPVIHRHHRRFLHSPASWSIASSTPQIKSTYRYGTKTPRHTNSPHSFPGNFFYALNMSFNTCQLLLFSLFMSPYQCIF